MSGNAIHLGLDGEAKRAVVEAAAADRGHVVVLSPSRFRFGLAMPHEVVDWPDIIRYRFFYRLLQEIGQHSLVVVNECLRTQDRSDLTYNCIRHFILQAGRVIVFQHLPIIDTADDFMILFDFATRSRWRREAWRAGFAAEVEIRVRGQEPGFDAVDVAVDARTHDAYQEEKRRLFAGIGLRDPHTIPRNLYLMSGRARLGRVDPARRYVGRNNRFKLANLETYREVDSAGARDVFELPHNFIDFADFLAVSRQARSRVLVADLKVDQWYLERYRAWAGRVADACAALR